MGPLDQLSCDDGFQVRIELVDLAHNSLSLCFNQILGMYEIWRRSVTFSDSQRKSSGIPLG